MAADGSLTKYGYPRGYRFVPTPLELFFLLSKVIDRHRLGAPLKNIFSYLSILDYHPEELYERYKHKKEHRYIYFFSRRAFQKPGAAVVLPEDKDQKKPRPVRVARGGGWKPSGGGQVLRFPRKRGGFVAGRMVTMVFYDRADGGEPVKTNWGMHEFIVPVDKKMTSMPTKYTRFNDLALYRLYILKSGDMEGENEAGAGIPIQMPQPNAHAHLLPSTSVPPCPSIPSWGIFTGNSAGASTSQAPPPHSNAHDHLSPSTSVSPYVQIPPWGIFTGNSAGASTSQAPPQHPSAGHSQYYDHQHAFGAAQPQAHSMPVHVAGMPAAAGNLCQLASLPAPVPVAAASPAAQQAAPAATLGAGQEAGHFGAARSPSPPPAAASPAVEQHAVATSEPAHAQFADCVEPMEEEVAPPAPLEDTAPAAGDEGMAVTDGYDGIEMTDWNFAQFDDVFYMEDFIRIAMEGDDNNSGGENCNQAGDKAGDTQEDPSAAMGGL